VRNIIHFDRARHVLDVGGILAVDLIFRVHAAAKRTVS
jgi:hypothetical protein